MIELLQKFDKAVSESKQLDQKPSNEVLLELYSFYKQATEGDATEDKMPSNPLDFIAKAKYSAWQNQTGKSKEEAMNSYISLIEKLK